MPRYQGIPWSLRVPWNAKWPQLIAVSLSNRPPQRIAQAILNICGRKHLDELAWNQGKLRAQLSWPGKNDLECGSLRIMCMLQLARKLPFVIKRIRNYELLTIGQVIRRDSNGPGSRPGRAKSGQPHPPYCILGLRGTVYKTVIHILKLSFFKVWDVRISQPRN